LFAQINRIYGVPARVEPIGNYQANFGFIID
jgi:pilus assembly protein CpaC